jgi:transcriptional regulator with XRE-family HTH domain
MDFYDRVKQLAKEAKNLTVQEFVISLGINHDSYYSLKRAGNLPRADEAQKIAAALGTTVEYLVTGKEPETSRKYHDALEKIRDIADKSL